MSFWELFKANLKVVYRNRAGFFWTVVMPAGIYMALSVLPIGQMLGNQIEYSSYLLPGLIALTIMQGGIYTLAYWTIDLKARGVIKRLQVTPIRRGDLILSLLLSRSIVMLAQMLLLTLIGVLFFEATVVGNIWMLVLLTVLGGFIFLPLGLLIATFADSYEAAAPITAAVGLPFTFLGNVFYPTDSLPMALQKIAEFLPITYLAEGFRAIYLGEPYSQYLYRDIGILIIFAAAIITITAWRFKIEE